jgi:mannosylglycerate hydrolase MGH1-like protein
MHESDPETQRLIAAREQQVPWKQWGPYLSERQWGTVREDYSRDGSAWDYFTHDQARARAYGWGEDGLAGISDDKQRLCFAIALWNGVDPILKERLFGLTNSEGNHGEDVKEYYFYLDSTPTHSYMKWLYKYPQRAYPYEELVKTNRARSRHELEYELIDTGVFDDDRYFDVFVEYAKATPGDILIKVSAVNRGPDAATLHLLPTLWFRRTWSAGQDDARPRLEVATAPPGTSAVAASHHDLGAHWLLCEGDVPLLFTENATNDAKLFGGRNEEPFVKDGIDEYVVHGRSDAVNPARTGTKAAAHHRLEIPAGETRVVRLRLVDVAPDARETFGPAFDETMATRLREADAFYDAISPPSLSPDERAVMRQALAGMLWSKQYYFFDLDAWLAGHGNHPLLGMATPGARNVDWFHMVNDDVIAMPDKWEYPWYAAWDLAFHTVTLAMVDLDFAKHQLELMLRDVYQHPSGQLPAYEWNFGDVNPPVHAWAALYIYYEEKARSGAGDLRFLRRAFNGLVLNFTWWLNRKDPLGHNVFEGGFLGLDNVGVFDRSKALPTGGRLEQADGTAWMVLYSQNMLEIALELAANDPVYEDSALRFFEHYMWVAAAMDRIGENNDEMWDEQDGFFYDVLRLPDGRATRLKVRSMVGLLPLCASTTLEAAVMERFPRLRERAQRFLKYHYELVSNIAAPDRPGMGGRRLLSVLNEAKLRRILGYLLDESEFLGTHGIRALSRYHLEHPYVFWVGGEAYRVGYEPAESSTGLFGGNSNWRGPIWMPMNALIVRALLQLYAYYGDAFTVECPTGSGSRMTLFEVAREIGRRLAAIFLRGPDGRRPVFGDVKKLQTDPHWRDHLQFYEYFHGDNGAGIGANHQTGWTGLVAKVLQLFGTISAETVLLVGAREASGMPTPPG